jgi:hypothetical protein
MRHRGPGMELREGRVAGPVGLHTRLADARRTAPSVHEDRLRVRRALSMARMARRPSSTHHHAAIVHRRSVMVTRYVALFGIRWRAIPRHDAEPGVRGCWTRLPVSGHPGLGRALPQPSRRPGCSVRGPQPDHLTRSPSFRSSTSWSHRRSTAAPATRRCDEDDGSSARTPTARASPVAGGRGRRAGRLAFTLPGGGRHARSRRAGLAGARQVTIAGRCRETRGHRRAPALAHGTKTATLAWDGRLVAALRCLRTVRRWAWARIPAEEVVVDPLRPGAGHRRLRPQPRAG